MVSFVFQTKKKRERRGKRRERSHFFVERSLRMELERENAASYWKISRARSWREESTKHTLSARANYSRKERERERERKKWCITMDRISTNDRCNRSTNLPRNTINPEEIWISLLPNGKSVDIPRIHVYIYISTRDCSTRFLLSNAFLRISRYFHDPKGWILLCTGESFCSRPDTSIV